MLFVRYSQKIKKNTRCFSRLSYYFGLTLVCSMLLFVTAQAVPVIGACDHALQVSPVVEKQSSRDDHAEVRILESDSDAIHAQIDILKNSQSHIYITYFHAGDHWITNAQLYYLREAARKGQDVRIIMDDLFSNLDPALIVHLKQEGVQFRVYHPFRLQKLFSPSQFFNRMHIKMIDVDSSHFITGGRNSANQYYGLVNARGAGWVDRDIYIQGKTAEEGTVLFLKLWADEGTAAQSLPPVATEKIEIAANSLDRYRSFTRMAENRYAMGKFLSSAHEINDLKLLMNGSGKDKKALSQELIHLIENAKTSVVIQSPYVYLTQDFRRAIQQALKNGAKISILVNEGKFINTGKKKMFLNVFRATQKSQHQELEKMGVVVHDSAFAQELLANIEYLKLSAEKEVSVPPSTTIQTLLKKMLKLFFETHL